MKTEIPQFSGFNKKTFSFLRKLEKAKYNNLKWFSANRNVYYDNLVNPSKAFVQSIGQFFNHLNPVIRTEPKFNKTLMRINKDMRFAKGMPYRTYFLIHFGRFKMDSEFYLYLDKTGVSYGVFINNSGGDDLYFNKNYGRYKSDILETCLNFKINNKYNLSELNPDPELRIENFNAKKHLDTLGKMKYILLEKQLDTENKLIFSSDLLTECIKAFSRLYPLYCFSISSHPKKLIDDFEERMGIAN